MSVVIPEMTKTDSIRYLSHAHNLIERVFNYYRTGRVLDIKMVSVLNNLQSLIEEIEKDQ